MKYKFIDLVWQTESLICEISATIKFMLNLLQYPCKLVKSVSKNLTIQRT